jgi:hypothetical protein
MNTTDLNIEITFVNEGRNGWSTSTTKVFKSFEHARNFKRKWTFSECYVKVNGVKATADDIEKLR